MDQDDDFDFSHPSFQRDDLHLLALIHRKKRRRQALINNMDTWFNFEALLV